MHQFLTGVVGCAVLRPEGLSAKGLPAEGLRAERAAVTPGRARRASAWQLAHSFMRIDDISILCVCKNLQNSVHRQVSAVSLEQ